MSYLSMKQTLAMRSRLGLVILAWLSMPAQGAWDLDYTLPINAENYPRAPVGAIKYSINTAYEVTQPVLQGQTLRFKVLIPPGTSIAKISAQSNSWQCAPDITDAGGNIIVSQSERCPVMDGFDHDPGDFCANNPTSVNSSPCGSGAYLYPQNLHTVTARLLDVLYPTESGSPETVTQPRYAYFVLYQQPQALGAFAFTSNLGISFGISDVGLYNQWFDTVIDGNTEILTITLVTNNGTVTSNPSGINCGHGGTLCSENYTAGSVLTLTGTAAEAAADGFAVVSWGGDCAGANNQITLTMDTDKICTATFGAQTSPKILTITQVTNNGTVTSNPSGISCGNGGTLCSASHTTGSRVTLTATAADGFAFASWGGHCAGATNPVTLTMDAEKTCMATFEAQTFPEIEVLFEGRTLLGDGSSTPIEIGTHVGRSMTKTFTVKNTGKSILTLTEITPPSGFSLVGNLPSIQPNSSADITVQLDDVTTEGAYSGTLNIINNDTDENKFNFVISGRVISERNLNDGSLSGNLVVGNQALFAGDAEIIVTVSVENSADFFEPLTRDDEKIIEQGRSVDINATITPESDQDHQVVNIVAVAMLYNQDSNVILYQKTLSQNVFNETGWVVLQDLDLSQPYVIPYGIHSGEESYSINVFKGQLPDEIEGFGTLKRVDLYVGYGFSPNPSEGEYSYLVSLPVTLEISDIQLVPDDLIRR